MLDAQDSIIDPATALSPKDVADRLGISPRHAGRLVRQWPHLQLGRRRLVAPATVQRYLAACMRAPEAA